MVAKERDHLRALELEARRMSYFDPRCYLLSVYRPDEGTCVKPPEQLSLVYDHGLSSG